MTLALAACVEPNEPVEIVEPQFEVAKSTQELQLSYIPWATLAGSNVGTAMTDVTGVIRGRNISPTVPFGSCGMTWVSKHYGVTAAHCVKHLAIRQMSLIVEQVYLGELDSTEFWNYATVLGDWSTGWRPGGTLTRGYATRRFTGCYVSRRCDTRNGGRQSCPITDEADIALIKCPGRTDTEHAQTTGDLAQFGLPADVDDLVTLNVDTWWYHELYLLPTEDDGTERWSKYGKYGGETVANQNWHYTREHQVLPLLSHQHPTGELYRTVPTTRTMLNETDTPICHGTSGSGVFISGTNYLLGPTNSQGRQSQIAGRLCEPADRAVPGASKATYIRAAITNAFVRNSPEVTTDY